MTFSVVFYIMNSDVMNQNLTWKIILLELKNEKSNIIFIMILFISMMVLFFIKKILGIIIKNQKTKLTILNESKQVYIQKFFNFIGEEMKNEIKIFLLGHEDEHVKNEEVLKKKLHFQ